MFQAESVAGIVFSKDKKSILFIQRRDVPIWVLPGGGVEKDELPERTIEREILEETGFEVVAKRAVGIYHPINRLSKKPILYECTLLGGDARVSNETKGVAFVPLHNLPALPPPYFEWIQDACLEAPLVERKLTSVNYTTLCKYLILHPVLVFRFFLAKIGLPWNSK